jgi:hypothetical protein
VCGGSGFPSSNVTKPAAAAMETSGAVCNHSKGAASATMRPPLACIYVSKPSERVHDRTLTSGLPSQETMLTCRSKSVSLGSFRGSTRRAPGRVWRPHSQQTLTLSTP